MENSIYAGLSRQIALQDQMDMVANNIANQSTSGYRAQNLVFSEYVNKPVAGSAQEDPSDPLSMVANGGEYQSMQEGPLQRTGNPLDVAVHGNAWFGVQTANGTEYTKSGSFRTDAQGHLITSSGDQVASAGGSTITIPQGATDIKISSSGTISTSQGTVGKLMVVNFANNQNLKPDGNGYYRTTDAANPATGVEVEQGMLEGSNVNPVLEMTKMIDVSRAYQATQQMMVDEHNRIRQMVQGLTNQNS